MDVHFALLVALQEGMDATRPPKRPPHLCADPIYSRQLIQGKFYENSDYSGYVFTVWGEELCDDDPDRDAHFTFPKSWRKIISSFQPWARCKIWVHRKPYMHGKRFGPYKRAVQYVGDELNDTIASVAFS